MFDALYLTVTSDGEILVLLIVKGMQHLDLFFVALEI